MTPEERELRRALESRSAGLSPEFRARLSSSLAEGRPTSNLLPALAAVAVVVLAFATVGVLLLARQARLQPSPVSASTPSASATLPPTLQSVAGVLTKPPHPIALPANAQLSAPSTDVVWALVVNQYLYRSTDRGATWDQRPTVGPADGGSHALEMSFVNDQEGWLTVSVPVPPTDRCLQQRVAVWHTADAGATWQLLGWNGIDDAQCKSGLSFVDPNHGFLSAENPFRPTVIYRTTDSGQTWIASAPLPVPPEYDPALAGGALPGGNMLAGPVRAFGPTLLVTVASQFHRYVYQSTDGGATWAYLAKAAFGFQDNTGWDTSLGLVTGSRWLQLMNPQDSRETTDAGASWHPYASDYSQAAPIAADLVFGDSLVGYATVRGGIARTEDGGVHWTAIETPGAGMAACC